MVHVPVDAERTILKKVHPGGSLPEDMCTQQVLDLGKGPKQDNRLSA